MHSLRNVFRTLPTSSQKYSRYTRWRWSYHAIIFDRILDAKGEDFGRIIFSPTLKERKLIAVTPDTIWIWIIHAKMAKWLNYTIKFNFTSGYYVPVQPRYQSRKKDKCLCWRVLAENWLECAQKIGENE